MKYKQKNKKARASSPSPTLSPARQSTYQSTRRLQSSRANTYEADDYAMEPEKKKTRKRDRKDSNKNQDYQLKKPKPRKSSEEEGHIKGSSRKNKNRENEDEVGAETQKRRQNRIEKEREVVVAEEKQKRKAKRKVNSQESFNHRQVSAIEPKPKRQRLSDDPNGHQRHADKYGFLMLNDFQFSTYSALDATSKSIQWTRPQQNKSRDYWKESQKKKKALLSPRLTDADFTKTQQKSQLAQEKDVERLKVILKACQNPFSRAYNLTEENQENLFSEIKDILDSKEYLMQQKMKKVYEDEYAGEAAKLKKSGSHFIRQDNPANQAAKRINRQAKKDKSEETKDKKKKITNSGISVIEETESKQLNVVGYSPLEHPTFQVSYFMNSSGSATAQTDQVQDKMNRFSDKVRRVFNGEKQQPLLVFAFSEFDTKFNKDYIVYPERRLEYIARQCQQKHLGVNPVVALLPHTIGLRGLLPFAADGTFVFVHLFYSKRKVFTTVPDELKGKPLREKDVRKMIVKSDLLLGFWFKDKDVALSTVCGQYHCSEASDIFKFSRRLLKKITSNEEIEEESLKEFREMVAKCANFGVSEEDAQKLDLQTLQELVQVQLKLLIQRNLGTKVRLMKSQEDNLCKQIPLTLKGLSFNMELYLKAVDWDAHSNSERENLFQMVKTIEKGFLNHQGWLYEMNRQKYMPFSFVQYPVYSLYKNTRPPNMALLRFLEAKEKHKILHRVFEPSGRIDKPFCLNFNKDQFICRLFQDVTYLKRPDGHTYKRVEYYFNPDSVPEIYYQFAKDNGIQIKDESNPLSYPTGAVSFIDYFKHEELLAIEEKCLETEKNCSRFLANTAQQTYSGEKLVRTKFFFNFRYLWTDMQLNSQDSRIAHGVRADVSQIPRWMNNDIVKKLEDGGIVPKDFINEIAMNVYHDGSEGLQSHFDDASRFMQPIHTFRLFSDSRLSFGGKLGFLNNMFFAPLPRGCISQMKAKSFVANYVKHSVRPTDMTGRSAAIILRQIHPIVAAQARDYELKVALPRMISSLSLNDYSTEKKQAETGYRKFSEQMNAYNKILIAEKKKQQDLEKKQQKEPKRQKKPKPKVLVVGPPKKRGRPSGQSAKRITEAETVPCSARSSAINSSKKRSRSQKQIKKVEEEEQVCFQEPTERDEVFEYLESEVSSMTEF